MPRNGGIRYMTGNPLQAHKKSRTAPNERDKKVRDQTGAVATSPSGALLLQRLSSDHFVSSRMFLSLRIALSTM